MVDGFRCEDFWSSLYIHRYWREDHNESAGMVKKPTGNLEIIAYTLCIWSIFLKLTFQKSDGSFPEPGRIIHSNMQGQSSKGVALTAYVTIAFAQNEVSWLNFKSHCHWNVTSFSQTNAKKYADVIAKALRYVKTTLDSVDDIYSLAIATYAAQLANHPSKIVFLQKLDKLAKVEGRKNWI